MVTRMPQVYGDNMCAVKLCTETSQHHVEISAALDIASHMMET
jgi:hypothetical protein